MKQLEKLTRSVFENKFGGTTVTHPAERNFPLPIQEIMEWALSPVDLGKELTKVQDSIRTKLLKLGYTDTSFNLTSRVHYPCLNPGSTDNARMKYKVT